MISPLEIALKIKEREEHNTHEDEAHRLMGVDIGEVPRGIVIDVITHDGTVITPVIDD
jgi:hypothetical protein